MILRRRHREQIKEVNETEQKEQIDFKSLSWHELREYATNKGIEIHGKKRKEIEEELATLRLEV